MGLPVGAAPAAGEWPAATRRLVGRHNRAPAPTLTLSGENPFLISLVDALSLKVRGWGGPALGARTERVLVGAGAFVIADGTDVGLDVRYWTGEDGAPLAVYLPGSFQGAEDEDTHRMVVTLRELGYAVLVIPDPLGREYMASSPVAMPASYEVEAKLIRAAIDEISARHRAGRVRLIAASHGAFLASMVWALDRESPRPRLEDASLLFPQADLKTAIDLIDGYITTPLAADPPRALVGGVFQGALRNLVKRLQRGYLADAAAGFLTRTYPVRAARELGRYRRSTDGRRLTFRRVIEAYVARPEITAHFDGRGARLFEWLGRGYGVEGIRNVRVMVASDDWTNAPDAWVGTPAWLSDDRHFLTIHRAGHAGLVSEAWFARAIRAAMAWR